MPNNQYTVKFFLTA